MVIWKENDSRGTAEEKPESPEQGHEGVGQREGEDGAAGKKNNCIHFKKPLFTPQKVWNGLEFVFGFWA